MEQTAEQAVPENGGSKKRGCIIGCAVVLVLGLVTCVGGGFWVVKNPGKVASMSLKAGRQGIMGTIDPAAPQEVAGEFTTTYDALVEWLGSTDMKDLSEDQQKAFGELMNTFKEASSDQSFDEQEMRAFIDGARELMQ